MDASHNIPLNKQVGRLNRLIVWHGTCSSLFVCDRTPLFLIYSELFPKYQEPFQNKTDHFQSIQGCFQNSDQELLLKYSRIFLKYQELFQKQFLDVRVFQKYVGVFPKYSVAQVSKSHPAWVRLSFVCLFQFVSLFMFKSRIEFSF